jgi:methionyl-tRNA formyltransferase
LKALLLGRKPAASEALRRVVALGVDVVAVVAPLAAAGETLDDPWRPLLSDTAAELGIQVVRDSDVYADIARIKSGKRSEIGLEDLDIAVSFLFWNKIKQPLIEFPKVGCFNFHSAPLPEFRGRRGYNFAILEGHTSYGASVHWVTESFDCGDLVEVRRFPMSDSETALSLEQQTMAVMLDMLDDFLKLVMSGKKIPATPQGPGKSATKTELLAAMAIRPEDDAETIERKVRAFWYPPFTGATVNLKGGTYTLVDAEALEKIGRFIHGSSERSW